MKTYGLYVSVRSISAFQFPFSCKNWKFTLSVLGRTYDVKYV